MQEGSPVVNCQLLTAHIPKTRNILLPRNLHYLIGILRNIFPFKRAVELLKFHRTQSLDDVANHDRRGGSPGYRDVLVRAVVAEIWPAISDDYLPNATENPRHCLTRYQSSTVIGNKIIIKRAYASGFSPTTQLRRAG